MYLTSRLFIGRLAGFLEARPPAENTFSTGGSF
jgi:hypothetical protein